MSYVIALVHRVGVQEQTRERSLSTLAGLQHGVVARWQLLDLGFGRARIERRIAHGHLNRVQRGVYAVGHDRLTRHGRLMAAVLACGTEAVISHRSAISLWELRPPAAGPIEVTDPSGTRHSRPGIKLHHSRALGPTDVAVHAGVPVTSISRALLDYAAIAHRQQLRLAVEEADRKGLADTRALDDVMERNRGHNGRKRLQFAIAEVNGPAPWTRSELERRFLALIRDAGIPEPQANVVVAGEQVDFFWPGPRVVVEVDSWGFHKSRKEFERDRLKDTKLQLADCRVLRVTQHRMEPQPAPLLADLRILVSVAPAARGGAERG